MGAILEHYNQKQMEKHNFVTIADLSKEKITYLLEMAQEFEKHPNRELLKGKVVATLFFEPSTRTQLSFQTAANRLGARVIGFSDAKTSSTTKGETLKDTILMVSNYADVIAMRHFIEGAAQYASEVAPVPIVNAGDGAHMHPSQCLLDLYSIYKTQGTLENLNISSMAAPFTHLSLPCAISILPSTSSHLRNLLCLRSINSTARSITSSTWSMKTSTRT